MRSLGLSAVRDALPTYNAGWLIWRSAHNLLRWTALLGLGTTDELVVAKTQRRALLGMPGRLTCSARRCRLHLPAGWPWAPWFELALARLRAAAAQRRPRVPPNPATPRALQPSRRLLLT